MVIRTRRALRDRTTSANAAQPATPTKPKRKKPTRPLRDATREVGELRQGNSQLDYQALLSNAGTSFRTLPALRPTSIITGKTQKRNRAAYPSSLPPSSPLASSPAVNNNYAESFEKRDEDDPFGFLAVEKKLKAQRIMPQPGPSSRKRQRVYDDSDIENMYATDEEYIGGGVGDSDDDYGDVNNSVEFIEEEPPRVSGSMPHTPSKKSNKGKLVYSPTPARQGSSTPRIPSSPSPIKRTEEKPAEKSKDKGKGVRIGRPKKKAKAKTEQEENEEEMDASMMVEHLESLLPKRTVVRKPIQRGRKKRKAEKDSDTDDEKQVRKKKGKQGSASANRINTASKGKKAKIRDDFGLDSEQEKARRERIEYFKRLDEYELAKENVYVI